MIVKNVSTALTTALLNRKKDAAPKVDSRSRSFAATIAKKIPPPKEASAPMTLAVMALIKRIVPKKL